MTEPSPRPVARDSVAAPLPKTAANWARKGSSLMIPTKLLLEVAAGRQFEKAPDASGGAS
ncbi:hypothetical protein GCM10009799_04320 [Nocardiopsis rhodophaea]|uniref:Uncharacterized protein n=1 Tax=Nocardiopsis rhodophaea TaxID=280238 RepID=A0ABN2S9W8_9ACTN